jgi:hypothetical protein
MGDILFVGDEDDGFAFPVQFVQQREDFARGDGV